VIILLLGRDGQVGWELQRTLAPLGRVVATARCGPLAADLEDFDSLARVVREVRPRLIVNAAAYTAVDRAESEPDKALRINGEAPGVLAELAAQRGAGLIHYSTDYVFAGDGERPYGEDDATGPHSVYGRSKLAGENAIRASGAAHLILRTAWVYGGRGKNFLLTLLRLMGEREEVGVVADQTGSPTWSRLLAEATALLVARGGTGDRPVPEDREGVYHLTCGGRTTWFGFASAIRGQALALGLLREPCARVIPITTAEYPTPARRPAFSVLGNDKLRSAFAVELPDWEHALRLCLEDAAGTRPA
jgi:dTDP-4-dehydrorhamnose reductase